MTKKRTTRKKGLTTTEKLILGGGAVVGLYFLWDKVLSPMLNPAPPAAPTLPADINSGSLPSGSGTSSSGTGATAPSSDAAKFDPLKVLRKGSSPSSELKYSKLAFNSEIEMARSKKNDHTLTQSTRDRLAEIAKLPLLDTSTKFGDETEKVAKVILGAKTFTYSAVKQQKINMWTALGLGNPYN